MFDRSQRPLALAGIEIEQLPEHPDRVILRLASKEISYSFVVAKINVASMAAELTKAIVATPDFITPAIPAPSRVKAAWNRGRPQPQALTQTAATLVFD